MSRENGGRTAIVLSGGGADGAYEVGVLKALFAGRAGTVGEEPVEPDIFTGTSIGSFNASYLVSHWDDYGSAAITALEQVWLERLAGHHSGFRFRLDPLDVLDPREYFPNPLRPFLRLGEDSLFVAWDGLQRAARFASSDEGFLQRATELFSLTTFVSREPWERLVREEVKFENIRATTKVLRIAAVNWATGEVKSFGNQDMTVSRGPLAIMGSSAIPGFFAPAEIGSQLFVDGGVLLNTPLKPAIEEGATMLHVIYMDPDIKNIPLAKYGNLVQTAYRQTVIAWAAKVNRDIEDTGRLNEALEILHRVAADGDAAEGDVGAFLRAASRVGAALMTQTRTYRPLTVHRYHPTDDLGGALGLLDLNRNRLEGLVERGFFDAVHHDCEASGCILPHTEDDGDSPDGADLELV